MGSGCLPGSGRQRPSARKWGPLCTGAAALGQHLSRVSGPQWQVGAWSRYFWAGRWVEVGELIVRAPGSAWHAVAASEGQLFLLGLSALWQLASSPCRNPGWLLLLCPASPPWSPVHTSSPHPSLGAPAASPGHSHHRWCSSTQRRLRPVSGPAGPLFLEPVCRGCSECYECDWGLSAC